MLPMSRRNLQFGLLWLLWLTTVIAVLCVVGPWAFALRLNPWTFLLLWIVCQSLHLVLGAFAIRREYSTNKRRLGTLIASGLGGILPLATLLLFIRVFVIGGSSNVAQLAGYEGRALWTLWFHAWPLLFFGNPIAFWVGLVAGVLPPFPPQYWASFISRWCGIVAAAFAMYCVVRCAPDA